MKKTDKHTETVEPTPTQPTEESPVTDASTVDQTTAGSDTPVVDTPDTVTNEPPEPTPRQPSAGVASNTTPAKQRSSGALWLAVIALLVALFALAGSGYLYWQSQQQRQSGGAALQKLQEEVNQVLTQTQRQVDDAKTLVSSQVDSVNQNLTRLQQQSSKEQKGIEALQDRLTKSIQQVSAKQQNNRKDWLLAEAEYLLRLANQRVLMENTPQGALTLLKSADKILQKTDDVSIYKVRKALASDIAALEAVPTFDLQGSYLKLAALSEQVDNLRLIPLTDRRKLPDLIEEITPESLSDSWAQGLKQSWAKAMAKLEQLVVIQHRDEKIEPLLSPEQTYYLQQNLHLMLEQAQLSLLQRQQMAFDRSLDKAEEWVSTYFQEDDATTQAILRGIEELSTLKIAAPVPDISGSLTALKDYLQHMTRLKEEGAG